MKAATLPAALLACLAAGAAGAACPDRSPGVDVAVGIRPAIPFVDFDRHGVARGLAIDMWQIAERELRARGLIGSTEFVLCPSIRDQGEALASGGLDVVISPLTITAARMESYAFSQQYLSSGLTVMQRDSGAIDFRHAAGVVVDTVTQPGVVRAVLGFLALNLVVALLFRWALRAEGKGLEAEMGPFAATTAYVIEAVTRTIGLKGVSSTFRRAAGRILEIVLAVVGTALSATAFGVLTSAFVGAIGARTALPIEDVVRMRVAVLAGSTAEDFLHDTARRLGDRAGLRCGAAPAPATAQGPLCLLTPTWAEAADLLAAGTVDVVLGDWVALSYLARLDRYAGRFTVQPRTYVSEAYGWGITPHRPALRDGIDRILIDEMRQPEWRARIEGALGAGAIRPE